MDSVKRFAAEGKWKGNECMLSKFEGSAHRCCLQLRGCVTKPYLKDIEGTLKRKHLDSQDFDMSHKSSPWFSDISQTEPPLGMELQRKRGHYCENSWSWHKGIGKGHCQLTTGRKKEQPGGQAGFQTMLFRHQPDEASIGDEAAKKRGQYCENLLSLNKSIEIGH